MWKFSANDERFGEGLMDRKIEIGIISAVIALLFIVCLITIAASDNEGPVIKIDEGVQISFAEGEEKAVLLAGVTAYDKRDGDVTDTVIIESMFVSGDTLKVRYAAKDKHNNVTVSDKYREVAYTASGENGLSQGDNQEQPSDNISEEALGSDGEAQSYDNEGNVIPQGEDTGDNQEGSIVADYTAPIDKEAADATGIPVIRLTDNEVTIAEGANFQPLAYVAETYDDSGDVSRRIRVSNDYNTRVAGEYQVTFYVTDEDGNTSEPAVLILHVQGD